MSLKAAWTIGHSKKNNYKATQNNSQGHADTYSSSWDSIYFRTVDTLISSQAILLISYVT